VCCVLCILVRMANVVLISRCRQYVEKILAEIVPQLLSNARERQERNTQPVRVCSLMFCLCFVSHIILFLSVRSIFICICVFGCVVCCGAHTVSCASAQEGHRGCWGILFNHSCVFDSVIVMACLMLVCVAATAKANMEYVRKSLVSLPADSDTDAA